MAGGLSTQRNINRPRTVYGPIAAAVATLVIPANKHRLSCVIANAHATVAVYIGPAGVTIANGIPIAAGASFTDNFSTDAWYMIPASGTSDVRAVEVQ